MLHNSNYTNLLSPSYQQEDFRDDEDYIGVQHFTEENTYGEKDIQKYIIFCTVNKIPIKLIVMILTF